MRVDSPGASTRGGGPCAKLRHFRSKTAKVLSSATAVGIKSAKVGQPARQTGLLKSISWVIPALNITGYPGISAGDVGRFRKKVFTPWAEQNC